MIPRSRPHGWGGHRGKREGSAHSAGTQGKGVIHVWAAWRFVMLLRTVCSLDLIVVYFWSFLFSIFGLQLKVGNTPWKVSPQVRGQYCVHKWFCQEKPARRGHAMATQVMLPPGLHPGSGRTGGAGRHFLHLSDSKEQHLVSVL